MVETVSTPEEECYYELAILYASDIGAEIDYTLLEYAVVTAAIRHRLRGVNAQFIEDSIEDLCQAENITIHLIMARDKIS